MFVKEGSAAWTRYDVGYVTPTMVDAMVNNDGTKIIATSRTSTGAVWVSTDSGATWTIPAELPLGDWLNSAFSQDGKVALVTKYQYEGVWKKVFTS